MSLSTWDLNSQPFVSSLMRFYVHDSWLLVGPSTQLGQTAVGWVSRTAGLSCSWWVHWRLVYYYTVVLFMHVWAMFKLRFMQTLWFLSLLKHLYGLCIDGRLAKTEISGGALFILWPISHLFRYWRRRLVLGSSGVLSGTHDLQPSSSRRWLPQLIPTFWAPRLLLGGTG